MKKILSLLVVFSVIACTRSMPSSFYTLATTPSYQHLNIKNKMRIGIYVTIPKYIERPQIVTKKDEVEMDISEFHRWIEPVSDNIGQIVSENIMDRTKKITILPINTNRKNVDYVVNIDVKKFEGGLNN